MFLPAAEQTREFRSWCAMPLWDGEDRAPAGHTPFNTLEAILIRTQTSKQIPLLTYPETLPI